MQRLVGSTGLDLMDTTKSMVYLQHTLPRGLLELFLALQPHRQQCIVFPGELSCGALSVCELVHMLLCGCRVWDQ